MTFENNDELYKCSPMTKEFNKTIKCSPPKELTFHAKKFKLNKLHFMDDI
jgi:uncharacterized pyridoxamine 5'-phosphate oxidase family protein